MNATKSFPAPDKALLQSEFSKVWHKDTRMTDYCVKKTAATAILPRGEIVIVEKHSIETRFCFGESGYDYDDAARMAAHARTSMDYFKRENMEPFNKWLADLDDAASESGRYRLVIYTRGAYYGQDEDCRIRNIAFVRLFEVIDACGGQCYLRDLPGMALTIHGQPCRVATQEELDIIRSAYEFAAAAHEKKVDAYLKRYGTSKVHAWTYWRDA